METLEETPEILFYIFTAFTKNYSFPNMRPLDFTIVEIFDNDNKETDVGNTLLEH